MCFPSVVIADLLMAGFHITSHNKSALFTADQTLLLVKEEGNEGFQLYSEYIFTVGHYSI